MSVARLDGLGAYARVLGTRGAGAPAPTETSTEPVGDFGRLVEQMVGSTAASLTAAEGAAARQVAGQGDLIDVATAIGAAETALETLVAVRDKAVSAYQDIMRMQI